MRVVHKNYVNIIGRIWMPPVIGALDKHLSPSDIKSMVNEDGTITKEDVKDWVNKNSGDFQTVLDFEALIDDAPQGPLEIDWAKDESGAIWDNCMFGDEINE